MVMTIHLPPSLYPDVRNGNSNMEHFHQIKTPVLHCGVVGTCSTISRLIEYYVCKVCIVQIVTVFLTMDLLCKPKTFCTCCLILLSLINGGSFCIFRMRHVK